MRSKLKIDKYEPEKSLVKKSIEKKITFQYD